MHDKSKTTHKDMSLLLNYVCAISAGIEVKPMHRSSRLLVAGNNMSIVISVQLTVIVENCILFYTKMVHK